jgi:hypothetical protein
MNSSSDSSSDTGTQDPRPEGGEPEHAGNSGEGAASALAHLKTQSKQHRRQAGEHEDPSGGPVQ